MNNMYNVPSIFDGIVLQHATTADTTTFVGYLPANGVRSLSILCVAEMGNAADMTITVNTADDAAGTNATALTVTVPIYKATSGAAWVRQTDAKAFTETAATGTFLYSFEIPASIVPETKYIGVFADSGNASNVYSAIVLEDTYYKG